MTPIHGFANLNSMPLKKTNKIASQVKSAGTTSTESSNLSKSVTSSNSRYGKAAKFGNGVGNFKVKNYVSANRHNTKVSFSSIDHHSGTSGTIWGARAWRRSQQVIDRYYTPSNANMMGYNMSGMNGLLGSQMYGNALSNMGNAMGSAGSAAYSLGSAISQLVSAMSSSKAGDPATVQPEQKSTSLGAKLEAAANLSSTSTSNVSTSCKSAINGMKSAKDSSALSTAINAATTQLSSLGKDENSISSEIATKETKAKEAEDAVNSKNEEIKNITGKLKEQKNTEDALTRSITSIDNSISDIDSQISVLSNNNSKGENTQRITELQSQKTRLEQQKSSEEHKLQKCQDNIKELTTQQTEAQNELPNLEKAKDSANDDLKLSKQKLDDFKELSSSIEKARKKLDEMEKKEEQELDNCNKEISNLTAKMAKQRANLDQNGDGVTNTRGEKKASKELGEENTEYANLDARRKELIDLNDKKFARSLVQIGYTMGTNPKTGNQIYLHDGKMIDEKEYIEGTGTNEVINS